MTDEPYAFNITAPDFIPSAYDNHIKRYLNNMKGQYLDQDAYQLLIEKEDSLLYEVYELKRPEIEGELLQGISIVHPGKVGDEFNMTKGHFHTVLDTAEVYFILKGHGYMIMETPEGDWAVEELTEGKNLYVPPRFAHRSINIHPIEDLVMFFVYPANAGHDYGTIETQGFRKLVVDKNGKAEIIDNPRWKPQE
ncbi:MAG: glucose-6-phosphate isomerase [Anaerolineaceae bacterium]|nr:glucose-6-phosphate isomerase [Anaerolineaceae bacterium]